MNCRTCHRLITSLNSQRKYSEEGVPVDQCLPCAIEEAPFVRYVLKRRTELIDDFVLCQQHYREDKEVLLHPLTDREVKAGMTQQVLPYSGVYPCRSCNDKAEQTYERVMGRQG